MAAGTLLSGEADGNDAFLEIHSGAGGTESLDWTAMLARMYSRWANAHGYKVETMEEQAGEAAGLKSSLRSDSRSVYITAGHPRPELTRQHVEILVLGGKRGIQAKATCRPPSCSA